jgi:putative transposase
LIFIFSTQHVWPPADTCGMSLPRQIIEGAVYLLTRRCTQRQFLLKPSPLNNAIFLYCLALAAEKTGVLIHAVCVMSNHWHAVLSDPMGRIPEFMEHLHKYVAKCVNASLGRWENLWASEQPSLVRLVDDEDVLKRLVYTLTNPVEAFLVEHGAQWPGLHTSPEQLLQGPLAAARPAVFFRENGPTPAVATLKISRPAIFTDLDDAAFVEKLRAAIAQREQELHDEARRRGIRFLGVQRVRAQRHSDTPQSIAPRRNLKPRVAAANKWRRIEALRRLKEFVQAYRAAWEQWKRGVRDVLFPVGTYALALRAGAVRASS